MAKASRVPEHPGPGAAGGDTPAGGEAPALNLTIRLWHSGRNVAVNLARPLVVGVRNLAEVLGASADNVWKSVTPDQALPRQRPDQAVPGDASARL